METLATKSPVDWVRKVEDKRGAFRYNLSDLGLELIDGHDLVAEADKFFFNFHQRRLIKSLDETTIMIAHLMRQGIFWDYAQQRGLYTIPTLEFVHNFAGIIKELNPRKTLEIGAGDGALALYLKNTEGIAMDTIDDWSYGGKIQKGLLPDFLINFVKFIRPDKHNGPVSNPVDILGERPPSHIIKQMSLEQGLTTYHPDLVIASWLVHPAYPSTDDLKILRFNSVQHFLWIGSTQESITSSEKLWTEPGWKKEELSDLNNLSFTSVDGLFIPGEIKGLFDRYVNHNALHSYKPDASLDDIRQTMRDLAIQKGKVVHFERV